MEIYVVGGAVRDVLLGREPKDIDYVVVGATPEEMTVMEFKRVGADFPVFLCPKSGDQYALARTERKVGFGYNGFETKFDPSVTILDDLERRDLTINSMAVHINNWEDFKSTRATIHLIDPFSGRDDLKWHVLRHTSEAFSEDPIRVLRTARFAARYDFNITFETKKLMSDIVHELDHVPTERIWAEFEKGLMEDHPYRMFEVLHEVKAFSVEVMKPYGHKQFQIWVDEPRSALLRQTSSKHDLPIRFTLIGQNFTKNTFQSHRIPNDCAELCEAVNKYAHEFLTHDLLTKPQRLNNIMSVRALNRPEFAHKIFDVLDILFSIDVTQKARRQFFIDIDAIKSVDAAKIAADCGSRDEIRNRLSKERLKVML